MSILLEYPLAAPVVFEMDNDHLYLSILYPRACEAIANAYEVIYASPEKYGVALHDRADLVIESLRFFPERGLLYPGIGS